MKRIYATLMLLILLANGAGFYVYYVIQLNQLHREMRTQLKYLPDDQLEVLTLTRDAFEESKVEEYEVKVKGKMYDIARVEFSGNTVKVFCVHDEKEDNLIALLGELISKPLKDQSSVPTAVLKFINLNYLLTDSVLRFNLNCITVSNSSQYLFSNGIARSDINTPPPRQLAYFNFPDC